MRIRAASPPLQVQARLHPVLRWNAIHVAALVFVATLATRILVWSHYAVNWDSVQFALATEGFDLEQHRPHPPGYIGYVEAGRVLNTLTHDANTSFVLISVLAAALAPVLFLYLAHQMLSWPRAIAATVLFASSPLIWLYGGAGLTYVVEMTMALAFGIAAWRAHREGGRWLLVASLALAALGAVRQTGVVLLIPLWLWALWPATWTLRAQAAAVFGAASLLWLVPLLWLSGGPAAYRREVSALSEVVTTANSLWAGTNESIRENIELVIASLLVTLGAALLLLVFLPFARRLSLREATFLGLWILPGLAVFLAMHMGQPGYVLYLAPALFLLAGKAIPERWTVSPTGALALTAAVAVNAWLVFGLPGTLYRSEAPDSDLAIQLRQNVPALSDRHWREVTGFMSGYDAGSTAILSAIAGPKSDASYRHAMYYLPDYTVYGIGLEWGVRMGYLYTARDHEDDYSISREAIAKDVLPLPANVERIVVADSKVMADFRIGLPLTQHELDDGTSLWTAEVEPGTSLIFGGLVDGKIEVEAVTPDDSGGYALEPPFPLEK